MDATQPELLETIISKAFAQRVLTLIQKNTEDYFRIPQNTRAQTQVNVSSYTPAAEPEWEIVVAD